jgi:hypothetical protein
MKAFSIRGDGQSSPRWRMVPNLESFGFAGGSRGKVAHSFFASTFSIRFLFRLNSLSTIWQLFVNYLAGDGV